MKRIYKKYRPQADRAAWVRRAIEICEDYAARGYDLTLRQLYYQFVSRDVFANTEANYKGLGDVIEKARMGGFIDWDHIVDRTRRPVKVPTWDSPASIIEAISRQYRRDLWKTQKTYVEIWVEKEALAGVIEPIGREYGVTTFSCRGYSSASAMWSAAQRLEVPLREGKEVIILHLGDHDPSGIDMTRDIEARLNHFLLVDWMHEHLEQYRADDFSGAWFATINRLALNMDQVEEYDPPPNPAKVTDSRFASYEEVYGDESWELDALDPDVLGDLVRDAITAEIDDSAWADAEEVETTEKDRLKDLADRWDDVVGWMDGEAS